MPSQAAERILKPKEAESTKNYDISQDQVNGMKVFSGKGKYFIILMMNLVKLI